MINKRLQYYKETGTLLSKEEIYFYTDSGLEISTEFQELIKKSEQKMQQDVEMELQAIEEFENAELRLTQSKEESEIAREEAELAREQAEIAKESAQTAADQLRESQELLELKTMELEANNIILAEDNDKARAYNLDMEKMNSESSIKMYSLIIVMSFISIPVIGMMVLMGFEIPVSQSFETGIFSLCSMLVGSFLTKLLTNEAAQIPNQPTQIPPPDSNPPMEEGIF